MSKQRMPSTLWLKRGAGRTWAALWIGIALSLVTLSAQAAEVRGGDGDGDIFRLAAGEVINDDLYVAAGEIFIDGTVAGDLIAAGGYVEINGTIEGDALVAGGGVVLNGSVADDARLAGGGVSVAGAIGDDLFLAGGGRGWSGMPNFPIRVNQRTIPQGVQVTNSATIGGDAYLVGGEGVINGTIADGLFSGMGRLNFGGTVEGDAQLYAENLHLDDNARVEGTLRYGSDAAVIIPPGVASSVQAEVNPSAAPERRAANPLWTILRWLWRSVLLALGFVLLGWLLWRLAPGVITTGGNAIAARPMEAALYGLVAAVAALPLIFALILLVAIFWGWSGALAASTFLFGALGLLWLLSPLVTGYWVAQQLGSKVPSRLAANPLATWLLSALLIVLAARALSVIPCVGALAAGVIYLLSFALALGGLILARRRAEASALAPMPITAPLSGV